MRGPASRGISRTSVDYNAKMRREIRTALQGSLHTEKERERKPRKQDPPIIIIIMIICRAERVPRMRRRGTPGPARVRGYGPSAFATRPFVLLHSYSSRQIRSTGHEGGGIEPRKRHILSPAGVTSMVALDPASGRHPSLHKSATAVRDGVV